MKNIYGCLTVIILGLLIFPLLTTAEDHVKDSIPTDKKVYVISIPGLSFQEINPQGLGNIPNLRFLTEQGVIGSLNTRTPFKGMEDIYLTLGAGAFASSHENYYGMHKNESKSGESAEILYKRFSGKTATHSKIMIPEISAIHEMNRESDYHAQPGLLGETLKQAGVSVVVLGNRDHGKAKLAEEGKQVMKRSAPLMLMDAQGHIEHGAVDESVLETNVDRPYAVKTNYVRILKELENLPQQAVILIELGDLDRLYEDKGLYTTERFEMLKKTILGEIDSFVGSVFLAMESEDTLMVFSPQVHTDAWIQKSLLSPFFMYQHKLDQGIITSNTTRRLGVISLIDIAPSILESYSFSVPTEMAGTPIRQHTKAGDLEWLHSELKKIEQVYRLRPKLLYPFVIYQMIVLLLGLLFAFQSKYRKVGWMVIPLFSILMAPLLLLQLEWLYAFSNLMIVLLFFFLILITGVLLYFLPTFKALGILSSLTVVIILLDGLFGAEWMKRSVLGYDPMVGARYYGIGNEYMGILIGAAILWVSIGMHFYHSKYPRTVPIASLVLFILIITYLASPSLGTNAGGAISAVIAFGIAGLRMFCGKFLQEIRWLRFIMLTVMLGIVGVAVLWFLNYFLPAGGGQQSHIGRAMALLFEGETDEISGIIARKLAMNWHLIGVSSWSKVLMTSLFVMAVIVLRPRGVFERWQQTIPYIMYGFSANAVGAIVVLFMNDSGIVAAATMMIFVAVPMLIIKLQDKRISHSS